MHIVDSVQLMCILPMTFSLMASLYTDYVMIDKEDVPYYWFQYKTRMFIVLHLFCWLIFGGLYLNSNFYNEGQQLLNTYELHAEKYLEAEGIKPKQQAIDSSKLANNDNSDDALIKTLSDPTK